MLGFAEFGPMVIIWGGAPDDATGFHMALKFVPEMPKAPPKPPAGEGVRPHLSNGTPTQSQRTPMLRVRFEATLKSSLMNPLASRCTQARRLGYGIHAGFLPLATPNPSRIDETEPVRSVSRLVAKVWFDATSPGIVVMPCTAVLPAPRVTEGTTLLLMLKELDELESTWKPHLKECCPRVQVILSPMVYTGSTNSESILPGMGLVKLEKPGV